MHDNDPEQGVPGAQLAQPLPHHRGRAHDQGSTELPAVVQPCQESCHLRSATTPSHCWSTNSRSNRQPTWAIDLPALRTAQQQAAAAARTFLLQCSGAKSTCLRSDLISVPTGSGAIHHQLG